MQKDQGKANIIYTISKGILMENPSANIEYGYKKKQIPWQFFISRIASCTPDITGMAEFKDKKDDIQYPIACAWIRDIYNGKKKERM